MVLGKVRCAKKREVLIEELNKLKEELASLRVAKVIRGHWLQYSLNELAKLEGGYMQVLALMYKSKMPSTRIKYQ